MDYAIFRTGGKQYRVKPGDVLDVEKLPLPAGSIAELGDVLAVCENGEVTFGSPVLSGARVLAQVQSQHQDRKILVFKYLAKKRYRRKKGHRQNYTRLVIQDIRIQ
jgi:large subunit ribosomal protein L21